MTHRLHAVSAGLLALSSPALAQSTSSSPLDPPPNGVRATDPAHHALTNATIHPSPSKTAYIGTIVFRDGVITAIGPNLPPPDQGASQHDMTGLHIYPGLIEPFFEVDEPADSVGAPTRHWNPMVTPHHAAVHGPGLTKDDRESLRALGFVAANLSPKTGTFRGLSGVVSLAEPPANPSLAQPPVYLDHSANVVSFDTTEGKPDASAYPVSHMGAVALIRQTIIDSDWQRAARDAGHDIPSNTLDALDPGLPLLFDVDHPLKALSAGVIAEEFSREAIIVADGREYQRLDAIVNQNIPLVLPLRYPARPNTSSIGALDALDLADLQSWEQAPTSAARLHAAGLTVALTSGKLKNRADFSKNLRDAIEAGLSEDDALAMLTTVPAELLNLSDRLGALATGKMASFIVADGPLFDKDTKILEVWIDGVRHQINERDTSDAFAGVWNLTPPDAPDETAVLTINPKKKSASFTADGETYEARDLAFLRNTLSLIIDPDIDGSPMPVPVTLTLRAGTLHATFANPFGGYQHVTGTRTGPLPDNADMEDDDNDQPDDEPAPDRTGVRFGPYALPEQPPQEAALFVNATIWTASDQGIFENAWIFIEGGKIRSLGTGPAPRGRPNTRIIDCQGKHITPGLIDAHSHTGLFALGVNEGSQASTAEVRIHDALDPAHINWYRQLAAGVTTVNSLHGSANPIGGQNAVHKVRWGSAHPRDMLMRGAKPGIKFALGENVRQVNWGDDYRLRYPQSRMGVETFIRDRFLAAREYARAGTKPRSDGATEGVDYAGDAAHQNIPGSHRLAARDGVGARDLLTDATAPPGGTLRFDDADASFGGLDPLQYRRGARTPEHDGLHPIPPDRTWLAGRTADPARARDVDETDRGQSGDPESPRRDRPNPARAHPITGDDLLQTKDTLSVLSTSPSWLRGSVPSSLPLRRDLELEALAEILAGDRLIHCHSYRQDEILMLCRVAEDFAFKIGSFQHVLEGYKVAEAIKEHALGASCFSDWWAYKVEVQDAIPYNGPIMHAVGVPVSYNSDSDELVRRMNTEAAKAVKYGNLDPHEALKFVTLNPAIQLAIDDRVGSLAEGKDADLVIWSGDPLSSLSACESTWIDGREYFSLERDRELRDANDAERRRIIAKLLKNEKKEKDEDATDSADEPQATPGDPRFAILDHISLEFLDNLDRDTHDTRGDCGCTEEAWLHNLIQQ